MIYEDDGSIPDVWRDTNLPYDNNTLLDPNKLQNNTIFNTWIENLRFNVQTTLDTIAQNLNTAYENYKINQELNQNQNVLSNYLPDPIIQTNTNLIHEELAEKEQRIRHLETNEFENKKRIELLENEMKELKKKKSLLKWWERATEDSKKERII